MKMTFNQYILNPLGKENAVFSNREMYKSLYTTKLNNLLVREVGKVSYKLYIDKKNDKFYVYFKIPSETVKDFYYDTVIEFYPDPTVKTISLQRSLSNYLVKFYSNDPSFVFTFAYAFNKQNILIDDFKSKIPNRALKDRAVEKNPKALVGYVKSIYFSYLLMKRYSLFNKIVYESAGLKYSKSALLDQIMSASEKIDLRIEAGNLLSKNKKLDKKKDQQSDHNDHLNRVNKFNDKSIGFLNKNISTTKSVKVNNQSFKTKRSSKISKIQRRRKPI